MARLPRQPNRSVSVGLRREWRSSGTMMLVQKGDAGGSGETVCTCSDGGGDDQFLERCRKRKQWKCPRTFQLSCSRGRFAAQRPQCLGPRSNDNPISLSVFIFFGFSSRSRQNDSHSKVKLQSLVLSFFLFSFFLPVLNPYPISVSWFLP